jgi:hypothetical protein
LHAFLGLAQISTREREKPNFMEGNVNKGILVAAFAAISVMIINQIGCCL